MGLMDELDLEDLDQEQAADGELRDYLAEFDDAMLIVARYRFANHSALNEGAASRDVHKKARALVDAVKGAQPSGDVQPFECERVTAAVIDAGKLLAEAEDRQVDLLDD